MRMIELRRFFRHGTLDDVTFAIFRGPIWLFWASICWLFLKPFACQWLYLEAVYFKYLPWVISKYSKLFHAPQLSVNFYFRTYFSLINYNSCFNAAKHKDFMLTSLIFPLVIDNISHRIFLFLMTNIFLNRLKYFVYDQRHTLNLRLRESIRFCFIIYTQA